jgi:hypothetical protein
MVQQKLKLKFDMDTDGGSMKGLNSPPPIKIDGVVQQQQKV